MKEVNRVELLGVGEVEWKQGEEALEVRCPGEMKGKLVVGLRVKGS